MFKQDLIKEILKALRAIKSPTNVKVERNPNYYYPLPECLTIKESGIHGLGLFATEDIPANKFLGLSHYHSPSEGILRLPLGGFYNHSDTPNAERLLWSDKNEEYDHLITIKDIQAGEEITVKYSLYKIEP